VLVPLLAGLAACSDDAPRQGLPARSTGTPVPGLSPTPTPTPSPSATTSPTASPSPSAAPSGSASAIPGTTPPPPGAGPPPAGAPASPLELRGDDLGVTRVGAPFREAVTAVTGVLGEAEGDPASDVSCVSADAEVTWGTFRLASSGGQVAGWVSTSTTLQTPSGVRVGTTLADLQRVYGERLRTYPASPDAGVTFDVQGVALGGSLSGDGPAAVVAGLFNGACSPP